jgi:hypothetical protein
MIRSSRFLFGSSAMRYVPILLAGMQTAMGATVYYNDFSSGAASLSGMTLVDQSIDHSAWLGVASAQLTIHTPSYGNAFAQVSTASFVAPYSSILKNNPGTVTWAFNVSNQDGAFNNAFFFILTRTGITSDWNANKFSYLLQGGGGAGNAMEFQRAGFPYLLMAIPSANGLGPLPSKGSFRITYEPSTDLWSLYGVVGTDYVDPTTVTTLLGSAVDRTFTTVPLPYMAFGGAVTGSDYFDNITVSVVPEPGAIVLVALAIVTGVASRLWQSKKW